MSLTIKRSSSGELRTRKRALEERVASMHGSRLNFRDLKDLAVLGRLSKPELELYDELRRVKFLLDD